MTEPACPNCGGQVVVGSDKRAWCLKPYDEGGCGSFWSRWKEPERCTRTLDLFAPEEPTP